MLGRAPKRTNKPWITDETLHLMGKRRKLKNKRKTTVDNMERYRRAKKEVQKAARRDKCKWLQERCEEVEDGLRRHDTRKAYDVIKSLRKGFVSKQRNIKDAEGRGLCDLRDILKRWKSYAESLFDDRDSTPNNIDVGEQGPEIMESEVQEAIRRLPRRKATGADDFPAELLKTNNKRTVQILCKLCNKILETGVWPEDWLKSMFIMIPKVSGTTECADHRTIALISHASKIILRILLQRTQKIAEEQFAEVQMGFRKTVGTRDQIFNLRIIMEKAREFNIPLYLTFIDYKKAFDSVRHSKLWAVLTGMGVSSSIVNILRKLYSGQQAAVRVEGELTEWFSIKKGVRQGCLMSPMLFNFYSEEVMRQAVDELTGTGITISGQVFNNLRYADDIVLIATSPAGLQSLLNEVDKVSGEFQLEINSRKTKVMAATRDLEDLNIYCRGVLLEKVDKFKYLGSSIEQSADVSQEIRVRLGAARSALSSLNTLWKDRALFTSTKLKLLHTLVWPVALYGCESWTLKAADINRLKAFEMTCYRCVLRIRWSDRRTNESVLREMQTQRQIVATVKKRKLQYFGHIVRAQNISTHIMEGRIDGRRSRGRQRRRWTDDIKDWTGHTLTECTSIARDRNRWRALVHACLVPDPHQ